MAYDDSHMPMARKLREVEYVNQVNATAFKASMKTAMECPKCKTYCEVHGS